MPGTGPEDLHSLAVDFLDACVAALDTISDINPALGGSPLRAFVAPGPPAIDCCDQLTVHVAQIDEGSSAPPVPRASTARINLVTFVATITRCVPTIDDNGIPPTSDSQQEAAEQINADQWALWNHLYNRIHAGLLFDRCCDIVWGSLRSLTPSGACGGSSLTITVCFGGYEELIGG
jgi:hypothetical protein